MRISKPLITAFLVACIAAGLWYYRSHGNPFAAAPASVASTYQTPQERDVDVRFDMEVYDSIKKNYWQSSTDAQLAPLFQQSVDKALQLMNLSGTSTALRANDRAGVSELIARVMTEATTSDEKKTLAVGIAQVALYNLPPAGRNELLSQEAQQALSNEVNNVNPGKDLYADLGLATSAPSEAVSAAYQRIAASLKGATSSEAQAKLSAASYASDVLSNAETKSRYDSTRVEPSVFPTVMGSTLYIYASKMTPTFTQEFVEAIGAASTTPGLSSMILDLRGNIGGDLQDSVNFLGLFIGANQYAFDLYGQDTGQGNYQPVRTTAAQDPDLARYREIAILTDEMTQSTAEAITAEFKRYHLAYVVGTTTRGWGTVENTYPLSTVIDASTTYALLLVHYITLNDAQQPVQGSGVKPNVSTGDRAWRSELSNYFSSNSLINALKRVTVIPPIQ